VETIPQSSNSHSVAADSKRHFVYVPQVGPASNPAIGSGGDVSQTINGVASVVGAGICGTANGCIAVYGVRNKGHGDDDDHEHEDDDGGHGGHGGHDD